MHRNELGASLIELIMILVISGLLATMAARRVLRDASKTQQKNAARTALRDFTYARNQAMIHGRAVAIKINIRENHYTVKWAASGEYLENPVAGGPFIRQFGNDEFLHVRITDTGLANDKLIFLASGRPASEAGNLIAMTTAIAFNGGHRVVVVPYTGRLKLVLNPTDD